MHGGIESTFPSPQFDLSPTDLWTLRIIYNNNTMNNINNQGGITCGAINEPRKSSKAIDKRVIIDFRNKNVVIARFRDINEVFI